MNEKSFKPEVIFTPQTHGRDAPIKVAAYIRVSTDASDQENSYEAQEKYFNAMLSRNNKWISAGIYSDYGISGTSEKGRTGFRRIMRHCSEGRIDRIICKSISRFARNTQDFITALDTLRDNNISILFEKENIDTANASNSFILTALGAFAQEESRSISENVRLGIRHRCVSGIASYRHIYGYSCEPRKKPEIVKEEAEVVRLIFSEVAAGKAYIDIARRLNTEKIPPPEPIYTKKHRKTKHDLPASKGELKYSINIGWTARSISNIIKLERYTGDVFLQKSYVADYITHKNVKNRGELPGYIIRNNHPAIIERELFERVQRIRNTKSQRYSTKGRPADYPLSRLIVCPECGRFYTVRRYKERTIWFCPTSALNNGISACRAEEVYEEDVIKMCAAAFIKRFVYARADGSVYEAEGIIGRITAELEGVMKADNIERDCYFLYGKRDKETDKLIRHIEGYREELEERAPHISRAVMWLKELSAKNGGIKELITGFSGEHLKAFILSLSIKNKTEYCFHWFDDTVTTTDTACLNGLFF